METTPTGQVIRSKRRTLRLEVGPDALLVIRAPLYCPQATIRRAIETHRDWIICRQAYAREHFQPAIPKTYTEGEEFLYLSKPYKLQLTEEQDASLTFDGACFRLGLNKWATAPVQFRRWYRQAAQKKLKERTDYYAAIMDTTYHHIRITSALHRWGSCSHRGNLNFPWRLVMAPREVIDCIVVHELVHIEIKNHSRDFWQRVKMYAPDYKQHHRWLKENQNLLTME
ncbi:MAG: SprT family zinc-dependent metalloprotease [Dehalococcoidales bacterium]|nr:SprT family zinc-dependent metalloprotease [Dehalococcoidales bacterium]